MDSQEPFSKWRPHPWHGLEPGPDAPALVTAYIEITPFDVVKYKVDKTTGMLKVDRPQQSSSSPPTLYGFVPRTYCAERVAALSPKAARGDGDPIDICVYSERPINRAEIIVDARVIGGLRMIDGGEADDKIVAVLDNDPAWSGVTTLSQMPTNLIDRLEHYFATYKLTPGQPPTTEIAGRYEHEHARLVVQAAIADYTQHFGDVPGKVGIV